MGRSLLLLVAVAATVAATLFAREGAAGDAAQFRTPDAGAACRLEGTALVCGSLGSAGSLSLRRAGPPTVVNRLPWWDAATPVLDTWSHGGIACSLKSGAILCHNRNSAIRVDASGFAVAL